ncbi:SDR family oxidoreductase [Pendulispora rubella]|uniref:SDR family oxidoreductase n=1 Tax=Pendulispora rubella TaxID=2741070 RepID=A0ABZ2LGY9_9BACT
MKIVIPGISGGVGQKLALHLLANGHDVVGIDVRPWTDAPKEITVHRVDIRKRAAEDVFRRVRPEAVVHMATVTSLMMRGEERHRINLGGTRAVFDHCRAYGAKHCIFVGRHTFYGAAADSPLFHTEDEPPMALSTFPELADLVAADLFAATALWRFPELVTTVLRVCYTLGPTGHGTLATYLRGRTVPSLLGFDPLFQFMHEDDVVTSIALALERRIRGIFNVAGPPPVPFSVIVRETGRKRLPLPEFLIDRTLGRWGLPRLPRGALGHVKYPVVLDSSAFRKATGFRHLYDEVKTLAAFRSAFPPPVPRDA